MIILKLLDDSTNVLPLYIGTYFNEPGILTSSSVRLHIFFVPNVSSLFRSSSQLRTHLPGDFECAALMKEINKRPSARPMTHDLIKNTIEALGYRVAKVRLTSIVGNVYHARIHYVKGDLARQGGLVEVSNEELHCNT